MARQKGHFKQIRRTRFDDLYAQPDITLPESDLCFQNDQYIVQLEYVEPEEPTHKYEIKPGAYMLVQDQSVSLEKMEFRKREILTSVVSTHKIINEAKKFFSRLHIYDQLNRPKKRGVLLYSRPGMGKTSAIVKFCEDSLVEDPGTVIINWPTSEIDSDEVAKFLSVRSEYTPACSRLILIIEDIGGNEHEGHGGPRGVDSAMLNLLDGVDMAFRLPTFIVATTNYPQNLLDALADRPGRFDLKVELMPPSFEERVNLVEFISKRKLDDVEKEALNKKEVDEFSIAHLEECVIRSLLDDRTLPDVIKELIEHRLLFKKGFEKGNRPVGLGHHDDD